MPDSQPSVELQKLRKWRDRFWYTGLASVFADAILFQLPKSAGLITGAGLPHWISIASESVLVTAAAGYILTAILIRRRKRKTKKL